MAEKWARNPAAVLFALVLGTPASADFVSVLNVDFNGNSPTAVATDANGVAFNSFDAPELPAKTFSGLNPALTSGAVTVTLSNLYGSDPGRDRGYNLAGGGTMSGPFRDLFRSFIAFNGPDSLAPALTLSGLNPNTDYVLTFQSFDVASDHPGTTRWTDVTPGGGTNGLTTTAYFRTDVDPSGSITGDGAPAGGSASFTVRSNESGELVFAVTDPNGRPENSVTQINGFELSAAIASVPEPPGVTLAGMGAVAMLVSSWVTRIRRTNRCV